MKYMVFGLIAYFVFFGMFLRAIRQGVVPPLKQHFEYVATKQCFKTHFVDGVEDLNVKAGPKFNCSGPDKASLSCHDEAMEVVGKLDECLSIHVVRDK